MSYGKFTVGARVYDLSHLDPFTVSVVVLGTTIEVDVMFSFHLFTDQKGQGPRFPHHTEQRHFCVDRYQLSHDVAHFMRHRFFEASVRRHVRHVRGETREQYFCTDMGHGDIIWTRITRRAQPHRAHIWVASAYNRDWQGQVLPQGHGLFRVSKVLATKLGLVRP
ncbi:hypothetical protein [Stenotrophomonas sp.]|uniref:hypothetical protein n=1 Tax=Stenotrophomonas sp. TaxID=69392 RepID=UPI002FC59C3F